MNKQHNKSHLNLIKKLINCADKREINEIIRNNFDDINVNFLRMLQQEGVRLQEEDNNDKGNLLKDIVRQLAEFLGIEKDELRIAEIESSKLPLKIESNKNSNVKSINSIDKDDLINRNDRQLAFLNEVLQILQKIIKDQRNPQEIYPFLQNNINHFNENFIQTINNCANIYLVRKSGNNAQEFAALIVELGILINQFPLGDKAINLEIGIACYQAALQVYQRDQFPQEWAAIQDNLSINYRNRIKGNKADNLEKAILACENALQIWRKNSQSWANTLMNLGNIYCNRIKGNKTDNIEQAIVAYDNALQILTKKVFPREWADIQDNLANAYQTRIKGDEADNLEKAIECYHKALEVRTFDSLLLKWAETHNNLGNTYGRRIKGDKANNIEKAIECYHNTLQIITQEEFPQTWAELQNNIVRIYNIRIKGNKADNLEKAISACENALQVFTQKAFPQDWAITQTNLGSTYNSRIKGDKADNLEKAILAFENALQIITKETLPQNWSITHNSLAIAYSKRIKGDRTDNLEKAIQSFRNSLQVETPDNFPIQCLIHSSNLGNLGFKEGNWKLAIEGYSNAIEALENTRSETMSEIRRQETMAEAIGVYQNIVQSLVNLGQIDKAIEYAERSKNRNLVELLANRDLYPKGDISQTVIIELDKLRKEIVKEEKQLATKEMSDNLAILTAEGRQQQYQPQIPNRSRLNQLKQQLEELITSHITPIDPTFSLTQKVEPISFNDIKTLTSENKAIIQWYITNDKILTFIIAADSEQPIIKQFPSEDRQALIEEINNYLNLYRTEAKQEWQNQLESILENFAQYLHLNEIISELPQKCNSLILIPHLFIHLLPIHALKATRKQKDETIFTGYLLDLFPNQISYAPSCQLLQIVKSQERDNFNNLFGIQNPTDDLQYTDIEVDTIRQLFKPNDKVLVKDHATKENLNQQNLNQTSYSHFSSHGYFNFQEPLKSALILANSNTQIQENVNQDSKNFTRSPQNQILDLEKCLTLGEIFNLDLRNCYLVTLSACETGLTDLGNVSDEYISLPSGFLFAGCTNVVSSLWAVNDLSTAFLMIKFYQNHKQENLPVTKALNEAQKWLRDVSKLELQTWIEENQLPLKPAIRMNLRRRLYKLKDDVKPFKSPFYWAAFCAIGQ
ncbi:CHAT domain-containing protein [Okeanomitos corallinicola TIOX110]|uniref:CHAT domain-containing protein n=1 Tax=Okeanomitos corallinicola TIOX110 TaxID=3133117 RepID=A0ABZ2UWD9_9CYAN